MLRNINYIRATELLAYISTLSQETKKELSNYFVELPNIGDIDLKQHAINFPRLLEYLNNHSLFQSFLITLDGKLPLDIYLNLYFIFEQEGKDCNNYKDISQKIQKDSLHKLITQLHGHLEFICSLHVLTLKKKSWTTFTSNFDGSNWNEIFLLAELLPIANVTLDQFIEWISIILKKQERDGAIGGLGQYVYEWVILSESVYKEIEKKLIILATNNNINRFFTPLLKGLKEKLTKENQYFILVLKNYIDKSNALNVLYAIGAVSMDNDNAKIEYYNLLISKLKGNELPMHVFINLCNYFKLYKQELFSNIENILPSCEDPETLNAIIELLHNDADEIKNGLDHFLHLIANKDIHLAYDLFEFRLKIMAHMEMLEGGLIYMVQKDIFLFQTKLINWLNQEDAYLHTAVRKICSIHELGKSVFEIPAKIFESYNVTDKLYISYKIVGYVYSMEELQRLTIYLIKSINIKSEVLKESMHYILSEYLVYNYRSTLELLKNILLENNLTDFAKELFTQIIEEYENYFLQLKNISIDKELRPYKEHLLLKSFYMKKQFSNIPKDIKKNSIASLFKNTQLNSSKWAIRRPQELKHEVKELGRISVSAEFPSGEYLNPIYQEYIRKTYQNIKKDEINIH